eukprot:jgi/Mesvir1/12141/Mv00394-RA.1
MFPHRLSWEALFDIQVLLTGKAVVEALQRATAEVGATNALVAARGSKGVWEVVGRSDAECPQLMDVQFLDNLPATDLEQEEHASLFEKGCAVVRRLRSPRIAEALGGAEGISGVLLPLFFCNADASRALEGKPVRSGKCDGVLYFFWNYDIRLSEFSTIQMAAPMSRLSFLRRFSRAVSAACAASFGEREGFLHCSCCVRRLSNKRRRGEGEDTHMGTLDAYGRTQDSDGDSGASLAMGPAHRLLSTNQMNGSPGRSPEQQMAKTSFVLRSLHDLINDPSWRATSLSNKIGRILRLGVATFGMTRGVVCKITNNEVLFRYAALFRHKQRFQKFGNASMECPSVVATSSPCSPQGGVIPLAGILCARYVYVSPEDRSLSSPKFKVGLKAQVSQMYQQYVQESNGPVGFYHAGSNSTLSSKICYTMLEIESWIGTKLLVDGEQYGQLCFASVQPKSPFDECDLELTRMFAQTIGNEMSLSRAQHSLEEAKNKADLASKAKSAFMAVLSHEIRTPMNGVVGMAQVLSTSQLDQQQHECVDTIMGSSLSLLTIINDLLDVSKAEAGKMTVVEQPMVIAEVIKSALDIVAPISLPKRLQLIANIDPDIPPIVRSDSTRVKQILVNYLSNAIKFSSYGTIQLHVGLGTGKDPLPHNPGKASEPRDHDRERDREHGHDALAAEASAHTHQVSADSCSQGGANPLASNPPNTTAAQVARPAAARESPHRAADGRVGGLRRFGSQPSSVLVNTIAGDNAGAGVGGSGAMGAHPAGVNAAAAHPGLSNAGPGSFDHDALIISASTSVGRREGDSVMLRFSVTDEGEGIPVELQGRVFQTYSQVDTSHKRRAGGTGLGLVICKQLAELMGGSVGFMSEPGIGSTFWAEICTKFVEEEVSPVFSFPRPVPGLDRSGFHLVVIDSHLRRRNLVTQFLEDWARQAGGGPELAWRVAGSDNAEDMYDMLPQMVPRGPGPGGARANMAILFHTVDQEDQDGNGGATMAANVDFLRRMAFTVTHVLEVRLDLQQALPAQPGSSSSSVYGGGGAHGSPLEGAGNGTHQSTFRWHELMGSPLCLPILGAKVDAQVAAELASAHPSGAHDPSLLGGRTSEAPGGVGGETEGGDGGALGDLMGLDVGGPIAPKITASLASEEYSSSCTFGGRQAGVAAAGGLAGLAHHGAAGVDSMQVEPSSVEAPSSLPLPSPPLMASPVVMPITRPPMQSQRSVSSFADAGFAVAQNRVQGSVSPARPSKCHVLLVEKLNCSIDVANDGLAAVNMFVESQSNTGGRKYELVFMDVQLPVMDGMEATGRIRRFEAQRQLVPTPVIAMTANASAEDMQTCIDAGMTNFIGKPVMMGMLRKVMEKSLGRNIH